MCQIVFERLCPRKKILGPEIFGAGNDQKCHGAGLVSGPELSKYFEAELVQSIQGQKCLATGSVQKFRAGSVSWLEVRTYLGAQYIFLPG